MTDRLVVLIGGVPVGSVIRRGRDRYSFEYSEQYRAAGRIPLSPALPIADSVYKDDRVLAYLEGLLPEKSEVRERWASELGTAGEAFDLLAGMGRDCAGAVQFATDETVDAVSAGVGTYEPIGDVQIGDRLRRFRDEGAVWTLPDEHWSLPGAQDKFTLALLEGRWHEVHGSYASTHILKPGISRLKHQALVEHVTMTVASRLSLRVAPTRIADFDGEVAIVVERFDRYVSGDGAIQRIHQVDFAQAIGRLPRYKYEEHGGPSAVLLAQMLSRESADANADIERFSDAVIFNYLAGAPDGHAKNFSLLYTDSRARMAPLYDVATGFAYDRAAGHLFDLRSAAMAIGGRRKFGEVLEKHWRKHAVGLGLDPDVRLARVRELAELIPQTFEQVLAEQQVGGSDELADRLLPRLAKLRDVTLNHIGHET